MSTPEQRPRTPQEQPAERKLRLFKQKVYTHAAALTISRYLIERSQYFSVEPLPDDVWEIAVKEEAVPMLLDYMRWLGRSSQPSLRIPKLVEVHCPSCAATFPMIPEEQSRGNQQCPECHKLVSFIITHGS